MENRKQDLVLFIARRSNCDGTAEATKDGLRQGLTHTRRKYVGQYGLLNPEDNIKSLVFIQSSNKAFPRDGDTVRHIKAVLNNGRATNRPVVLAVNGWDGLSTNSVALVDLFRPYIDEVQITMAIWLQELQVFRKVSVKHAVLVLSGEYEGELEDLELPWATKEYIGKIQVIASWKNNISVDTLELRQETMNRNRVPNANGNGWFCEFPDCDKVCQTSERLVDHKHKHHGPKVSCRYCGREFTRTDHRDRHEKEVCRENPTVRAAKEAEPPKKRAKRGSKSKTLKREEGVVASDDGVPPYQLIQQNTWNFPRVDKDAPFSERVVYKMEVFCRFPECCFQVN
ncbi:hypothetical protein ASPSYDRAFT_39603 [Aspergillus sydowii CBS 593.65]|uniref:C2H2-type domain-containing protein n=1 Tax=Aspergillus sydowii CBS 593.65 TaxID=1036612 RepID=A0A1L9TZG8_9EURO|nr:uncharacterized protein ASPSYDRAFT_39603 [Aspergillus sydowii CBS 593.65]OJJ64836.1 hypothetical protein ASPSYDRAFT_39603 [Aspergillus sydowii CBS 593.65]